MPEMTTPESRSYLAHLMSEMLSLPALPADLYQAINAHLQRQFNYVNILNPEHCRRLYPIVAELAELDEMTKTSRADIKPASVEAADDATNIDATVGIAESMISESLDPMERFEQPLPTEGTREAEHVGSY